MEGGMCLCAWVCPYLQNTPMWMSAFAFVHMGTYGSVGMSVCEYVFACISMCRHLCMHVCMSMCIRILLYIICMNM